MHKKFEIYWTKIRDCCQLGRKVLPHNSKSDLPLAADSDFGLLGVSLPIFFSYFVYLYHTVRYINYLVFITERHICMKKMFRCFKRVYNPVEKSQILILFWSNCFKKKPAS